MPKNMISSTKSNSIIYTNPKTLLLRSRMGSSCFEIPEEFWPLCGSATGAAVGIASLAFRLGCDLSDEGVSLAVRLGGD
jgi:hypothetical protein